MTEAKWNDGSGLVVFMNVDNDDDPGWVVVASDLPCLPRVGDFVNLYRWPHNPDDFHHGKVIEVCLNIRPGIRTADVYYELVS